MTLQTNLGRIRRSRRYSQKRLAVMSGISQRSIAAYEVGEAEASLDSLIKLADALEVPLDELVGRRAPPPRVTINGVPYAPDEDAVPGTVDDRGATVRA